MSERPHIQIADEPIIRLGRPPLKDKPLRVEHTPPVKRGRPAQRAMFTWEKRITEFGAKTIQHYARQYPEMTYREIARHFGFTTNAIKHILSGRWKDEK